MASTYKSKFTGAEIDALLQLVFDHKDVIEKLTVDTDANILLFDKKPVCNCELHDTDTQESDSE